MIISIPRSGLNITRIPIVAKIFRAAIAAFFVDFLVNVRCGTTAITKPPEAGIG
jgi:hypothetical protein